MEHFEHTDTACVYHCPLSIQRHGTQCQADCHTWDPEQWSSSQDSTRSCSLDTDLQNPTLRFNQCKDQGTDPEQWQ
uniref:Uncharacterized protein n=1 Tax=Romanomermis culicivorax TaxID=13658 RepID=A0A915J3Y6_ROMCU